MFLEEKWEIVQSVATKTVRTFDFGNRNKCFLRKSGRLFKDGLYLNTWLCEEQRFKFILIKFCRFLSMGKCEETNGNL